VANATSDNVTELQASTGKVLGTFSIATAAEPVALAFDVANIWTANQGSNTVSKL